MAGQDTIRSDSTARRSLWNRPIRQNIKRLSGASSFEEALRIQAAFMHSQLNRLGKQTTSFGAEYTKPAAAAEEKKPTKSTG